MEEVQVVEYAIAWVPLLIGAKMLAGGIKAGMEDESFGLREGGQQIFDATKKLLSRSKNAAYEGANIMIEQAENVKESGVFKAGFGTRSKNVGALSVGKKLNKKGGFSTQTEIQDIVETQVDTNQQLYAQTTGDISKTYSTSRQSADLKKTQANIAYEEGLGDAQKELNAILADADDRDKGFFEGLIS